MNKALFITMVVFMLVSLLPLRAQQVLDPEIKIKELRRQLATDKTKEDTTLFNLHLDLGKWYLERNTAQKASVDSAAFFFGKAMDFAETLHDRQAELKALAGYCEVFFRKKQLVRCDECFKKVIDGHEANGDVEMQAQTWYRRGIMMWRYNVSNAAKYTEMLKYYENAFSLYSQLGESGKLGTLEVREAIADMHMCQGELNIADKELREILQEYQEMNHPRLHPVYYLLGVTNRLRGDLDQGLFYALKCVDNAEEINEPYQLAKYLGVVGDIYRELDNPMESIKWYNRALYEWEFNKSLGYDDNMPYRFLHYLIKSMIILGQGDNALLKLQEFENKFPPKDLEPMALIAGAKGMVYSSLKRYELAEDNYKKSQYFFRQMEGPWPIYLSELNQEMGNTYLAKNQYPEAKIHLLRALAFFSGHTAMSRRRELYHSLFRVDSAQGNYTAAIESYQKYKLTNDSIFNEKKSRQIEELEIQYETSRKENEISKLQNESAVQTSRLRQTTLTKNFTLGILVLFLIIIGLLLHSYFLNKRTNRLLAIQKGEIEDKNVQLQVLVEDKEWLLKEVHHRVKNNLQIVMSLLNTQSYFLKNEDAQKAIQNSQNRLFAISLIHQKLYKTDNLDSIDIASYMEDLVHHLKESFEHPDQILFDLNVEPIMLDTSRSVPIGLILNETITNSIKHGFPNNKKGTIKIQMRRKGKFGCFLTICDDGVGFAEIPNVKNVSSLGFSLIKGLCKQLNATLSIKSEKGVKISIFFVTEGTIAMDK
ncbi:hypothetical protein K1F50_18450 [Muricauda oceani]|uniref:histidine kinase n=1 Tax=Flagellimonas oceani TaxID=2698672 RepID=A0A6G7IZ58_9FLAO|nr:histidine kinase dimerization/phosphoacceptor domain -containing protein [Allomuricauda oceani]MBW8244795.1 hypothetical protein [Allomuricauda oceani]QII43893.1 hypothetical protein GVT53_04110 [Allomuricauda oceani]